MMYRMEADTAQMLSGAMKSMGKRESNSFGVAIEASCIVGEYDILLLSATQSNGLIT